jgi:hypothetical protein
LTNPRLLFSQCGLATQSGLGPAVDESPDRDEDDRRRNRIVFRGPSMHGHGLPPSAMRRQRLRLQRLHLQLRTISCLNAGGVRMSQSGGGAGHRAESFVRLAPSRRSCPLQKRAHRRRRRSVHARTLLARIERAARRLRPGAVAHLFIVDRSGDCTSCHRAAVKSRKREKYSLFYPNRPRINNRVLAYLATSFVFLGETSEELKTYRLKFIA